MKLNPPRTLYPQEKRPYVDEKTLQVQFFEPLEADVKPLDSPQNNGLEFEFLSLLEIGKKLETAFYKLVENSKK